MSLPRMVQSTTSPHNMACMQDNEDSKTTNAPHVDGQAHAGASAFARNGEHAGNAEPVTWTVAISDGQPRGLMIHGVPVGVMTNGKIDLVCLSREHIKPGDCETISEVRGKYWRNPRGHVKYDEFSPVTQACIHAVTYGWGMTELAGVAGGIVTIAADSPASGFDAQQRVLSKMLADAAKMDGVKVVDWRDCVNGLKLKPEAILCHQDGGLAGSRQAA